MQDEDLPSRIGARPDSDDGDIEGILYALCQIARNAFQDEREGAGLGKSEGVVVERFGVVAFALDRKSVV